MNDGLQDALIAWQGGDLPAGRADQVLSQLKGDAEFRRQVAEEIWTLCLTKVAQSPDPRWLALNEELGLLERECDSAAEGFERPLMAAIQAKPTRFVSSWWRWAATGAAAAAIVLSGMLLRQRQQAPSIDTETLAVLVPSTDAVWKGKSPISASSGKVGAGKLELVTGQARLLFTNGVTLDFEGPAELDLISTRRVTCKEGRLRANVPESGKGFCVETAQGTVTDLGTELGISVPREGKAQVAVFKGQAEVSVSLKGQSGVSTALLNESEQADFHGVIGEVQQILPKSFLPASQQWLPPLRLRQHYADELRSALPVHYWRMTQSLDGQVPNEIAGAPNLRLIGQVGIEPDQSGTVSALFRGAEQPGVLKLDKPWATPPQSYAVEFWFASDQVGQASVFSLTPVKSDNSHVALVEVGGRNPGHAMTEPGIVRFLLRWPPGERDGLNLYSAPQALPYQWHHLVAQQERGRLQLFVDGLSAGETQTTRIPESVLCNLHLGCLKYNEKKDISKLERHFSGRLAELAIYDRPLTMAEIQRRSQAMKRDERSEQ